MKNFRLIAVMKNSFFRKNSVFRQTSSIIFLLLLILLMVFQLVLYRKNFTNLEQAMEDSSQAVLSLVSSLSDETFKHLAANTQTLSLEDSVLGMAVFPDMTDRPRCFETVLDLKAFVDANAYVKEAVLLCNYDNTLLSSAGDVTKLEDFAAAGDLSAPQLTSLIGMDCGLVRTDSGELCLKCCFVPCSFGHLGQLLLYLDTNALFDSFCQWDMPMAIYADETLIYANSAGRSAPSKLQEGGSTLLSQSDSMGLTFYGAYGEIRYSLKQFMLSGNSFLMMAAVIPVLFLLAVMMAWIFYRPLYRLLESLRGSAPRESDSAHAADCP